MASDGVFAAARGVRPYLQQLLGPASVEVDTEIAEILADGLSNDDVEQRLRGVLGRQDETDAFLEAVLEDAPYFRPPQIQPLALKGTAFNPLPGDPVDPLPGDPVDVDVDVPMFVCPRGDYNWWQEYVGTPIPACPTHHCDLVEA